MMSICRGTGGEELLFLCGETQDKSPTFVLIVDTPNIMWTPKDSRPSKSMEVHETALSMCDMTSAATE
jgi:hypothetical protein